MSFLVMTIAVFVFSTCVATILWRTRLPCRHGIVGAILGLAVGLVAGFVLSFLRLADWHIAVGRTYIGQSLWLPVVGTLVGLILGLLLRSRQTCSNGQ